MPKKHTIVLAQYTSNVNTRTYADFESVSGAMNGICQLYEKRLKELNPQIRNLSYSIEDLNRYIDQLGDLTCLVFNPQISAYVPYNKEWIKMRIFVHLKKIAQGGR